MKHHIFPQEDPIATWIRSKGIDIHQWTVKVDPMVHGKGIHGKGLANLKGRWNARWREFMLENPDASPCRVYQFGGDLMDQFGLSKLPLEPY